MNQNFETWSEEGDGVKDDPDEVIVPPKKFRPMHRPSMGVLLVFDDGLDSAETIRIRKEITTIGRNADVSIPHDSQISDIHCAIYREQHTGQSRWVLREASDQCPLYVRTKKYELRGPTQFMAGSSHFSYDIEKESPSGIEELKLRLESGSVPGVSIFDSGIQYPRIRLCDSDQLIWLIAGEYWIGRAKESELCISNDEFLAAKHIKISREEDKWFLSSRGVTNGFWVRMPHVRVEKSCTFQIGEQRFRFIPVP